MKYLLLLISIMAAGCMQEQYDKESSTEEIVNVDSLGKAFIDAWNMQDSAAVMNEIADDAVAMNDSLVHNGKGEIAGNWVGGGVKVISNLNTKSLIKGAGPDLAYEGGTYTLNIKPPGGAVLNESGNYSLVWEKQPAGSWKLSLIHIEDVTRMPDVQSGM